MIRSHMIRMPLRQQRQQTLANASGAEVKVFSDNVGGFCDFRPLSGITTRMLQARNYYTTGCRRPSRFLEGTAIPNSIIRRELDTPTPAEERRAWLEHVDNIVTPIVLDKLQGPLMLNIIEEPAPFDRSALPTVSEMRLQKEREEACRLEKEAQQKLQALLRANIKPGERCAIAFGKRSTQECIAEAIARSKELQDVITANALGHTFRRESVPSVEMIQDSSDEQNMKQAKRGKRKRAKKSDSEATNDDKSSLKEDRVVQLIHSIKAGTPADISHHRNSLTSELYLMEQYRRDLEHRAMGTELEPCDPVASYHQQPGADFGPKPPPPSLQTAKNRKPIARPTRAFRTTPADNGVIVIQRAGKKSPERRRPIITPHITNVGTDNQTQQALKVDKYGYAPKVFYK